MIDLQAIREKHAKIAIRNLISVGLYDFLLNDVPELINEIEHLQAELKQRNIDIDLISQTDKALAERLQAENEELTERLKLALGNLSDMMRQREAWAKSCRKEANQASKLMQALAAENEDRMRLEKECDKYRHNAQTAAKHIASRDIMIRTHRDERDRLTAELEAEKAKVAELAKEKEALETKCDDMEMSLFSLNSILTCVDIDLEDYKTENRKVRKLMETVKAERDAALEKAEALEAELAARPSWDVYSEIGYKLLAVEAERDRLRSERKAYMDALSNIPNITHPICTICEHEDKTHEFDTDEYWPCDDCDDTHSMFKPAERIYDATQPQGDVSDTNVGNMKCGFNQEGETYEN